MSCTVRLTGVKSNWLKQPFELSHRTASASGLEPSRHKNTKFRGNSPKATLQVGIQVWMKGGQKEVSMKRGLKCQFLRLEQSICTYIISVFEMKACPLRGS